MVVVECLHLVVFLAISIKSTNRVQDLSSFFIFNLTAFLPQCWLNQDCNIVIINIIMLFSCLQKSVYALIAFGVIVITHACLFVGYYCEKYEVSFLVSSFLLASVMIVLRNVFQSFLRRLLLLILIWVIWDMHLYRKNILDSETTKLIC
jgi:hypothetical protein